MTTPEEPQQLDPPQASGEHPAWAKPFTRVIYVTTNHTGSPSAKLGIVTRVLKRDLVVDLDVALNPHTGTEVRFRAGDYHYDEGWASTRHVVDRYESRGAGATWSRSTIYLYPATSLRAQQDYYRHRLSNAVYAVGKLQEELAKVAGAPARDFDPEAITKATMAVMTGMALVDRFTARLQANARNENLAKQLPTREQTNLDPIIEGDPA